jgi:hypothetical protein
MKRDNKKSGIGIRRTRNPKENKELLDFGVPMKRMKAEIQIRISARM